LTVGIAFSPLRKARGNDPAPVASPREHYNEYFRSDFACSDDTSLAIVTPSVLFLDHRLGENPACIVKTEPALRAIARTLRFVPLKE
jgi:hypothetical protein